MDAQAQLLLRYLQEEREHLVAALDGLTEYDVRRPMTPTGTNLLGLVKHLATLECGYLGASAGRPYPRALPWAEELALDPSTDMWAGADESRDEVVSVYREAWAHSDESVRLLGLSAPATVAWWHADDRATTVGHLAVLMLAETAHHAGHADIIRESLDGRAGSDHEEVGDIDHWRSLVATIEQAAAAHRPG